MKPTHYVTTGGIEIETPRPLRPVDVLSCASYLGMRVFDAATDTADYAFAMVLAYRDQLDERTAFLREGMHEIQMLTSGKFIADGIEQAFEEFAEEGPVLEEDE